jgi:poly(hydroxyalkanoate) depolymerase family esterase
MPAPRDDAFLPGRFGSGPSARDYKLYVPPGEVTGALPLVVMLHGCTQDPDDFAAGTAMNDAARRDGFFVLYPAQSAKANPQRCWNWFKHSHQVRGRGEPAMLAAMTQDVIARHGIDPSRVYVAGLSAGGAMAAILANAYPDIFAAVGVHSGLPQGAARDLPSALHAMKSGSASPATSTTHSIPTIIFHGDADTTVHPANGETLFAAAAESGADIRTESGRVPGGHAWTRRVNASADGTPHAELWQVHGAAHAWSGGSARGSYTDAKGPDATNEMLRFFRQARRTSVPPM